MLLSEGFFQGMAGVQQSIITVLFYYIIGSKIVLFTLLEYLDPRVSFCALISHEPLSIK